MIRIIKIFLVALATLFTWHAGAQQSDTSADIVELDHIVALVNDDVLMHSELRSRVHKVRLELESKGIPALPVKTLEKQVLERLILQRLQLQEAGFDGILVDDQALNRTVQRIIQGNNLTLSQFRRLLERDGFSFAKFREDVRNEILIGRVRSRKVRNRVKVSDQEIGHLLENLENRGGLVNQYRLAHILIAVPDGTTSDEIERYRSRVGEVEDRLKNGEDFRQMAVTYSDSQTAMDGGDLGWRKLSEVPSAFEGIVPDMTRGEISSIIRTPSGFHIVQLVDSRSGDKVVATETKTRHILIRPSEVVSEQDARVRIEQLRDRISSGEQFAQVAQSNSDDTASAVDGGDLGWVKPGQMAPEFEDAMQATAVGEVSDPFSTPFGWHILQVEDRREYDGTLEFRRNKAREIIRKRKMEEELELWLRRLRDGAYVELRLGQEEL